MQTKLSLNKQTLAVLGLGDKHRVLGADEPWCGVTQITCVTQNVFCPKGGPRVDFEF